MTAQRPVYHLCPPDGSCQEQAEVTIFGSADVIYKLVGCKHAHTVPVESVTGEIIAALCLCCDQRLPARRDETMQP